MQRNRKDLSEVAGNAPHLDCGGAYMDFTWIQFIIHMVYFNQVDSKRKKAIKTEMPYSHETEVL